LQVDLLPDSLVQLGSSAFSATGLTSVQFGTSLTSISEQAFHSCALLSDIIFNLNLTEIGSEVFAYSGSLTHIILPSSIKRLAIWVFLIAANPSAGVASSVAP
jgi:hypothetical protein